MSATLRARRIAMDETAPRLFAAMVRRTISSDPEEPS
jgi:hypothetical protein